MKDFSEELLCVEQENIEAEDENIYDTADSATEKPMLKLIEDIVTKVMNKR